MTVVLKIQAIQWPDGARLCPQTGHYIQAFDVGACDGYRSVLTTLDLRNAAHFPNVFDAWQFWNTQSRVKPLREDGEPNRPLTSYTVSFEDVPP